MEEKQNISLIDKYLAKPQRPLGRFSMRIAKPTGITNIQEVLGIEVLDVTANAYRMIVSATRYSALVIPCNPKQTITYDLEEEITGTPEERFVYNGTATIYKHGPIFLNGNKEEECKKLTGWDFAKQGNLWLSTNESDLEKAIFGKIKSQNDREKMIDLIVIDYQKREEEARRAHELDRESQFDAGRSAGEDRRCF